MANARQPRDQPAYGLVRAGRAARRRGDDDAGAVPVAKVVVYSAHGCSLCERALEVIHEAQAELRFGLEVVGIDGDPELESRYREHLPVVEIDGERAFTHFVHARALRDRLAG